VATKHECVGCQKPPIAAGTVEVCAKVVEFLAIDLSDYVTGAVIPIDGGLVRGEGHSLSRGSRREFDIASGIRTRGDRTPTRRCR
jgi:hypothetical protein